MKTELKTKRLILRPIQLGDENRVQIIKMLTGGEKGLKFQVDAVAYCRKK